MDSSLKLARLDLRKKKLPQKPLSVPRPAGIEPGSIRKMMIFQYNEMARKVQTFVYNFVILEQLFEDKIKCELHTLKSPKDHFLKHNAVRELHHQNQFAALWWGSKEE